MISEDRILQGAATALTVCTAKNRSEPKKSCVFNISHPSSEPNEPTEPKVA
jgi:hypothetical protein